MSSPERLQKALEWFRDGVSNGRPAHAYMVIGAPRGDARDFTLQALSGLFGRDKNGREADPASHPDVLWVEPQMKSRITSVEQIREARQRMAQTAYIGPWKACVLVSADRLSAEAANAFLKTLEEPAGQSVFFLLTDKPEAMLPTVASRCQRIVLSSGRDSLRPDWQKTLMDILTKGDGSFLAGTLRGRQLVKLLAEVKAVLETETFEAAKEGDDEEVLKARAEAAYREVRDTVLRLVELWHRDILFCVSGAGDSGLFNSSQADCIRRQAEGLTHAAALRRIDIVENMKRQFDGNLKEDIVITLGFDRLYGTGDAR